ncbi:MAG: permease [Flaviaesturariibacter sp.]|nr:permease [Flaviaesturariibacter sp.]
MKRLDWYILRKFLSTFVFCMLMFTVIAVAVDSSEKTDDFVRSGLSTGQIISNYYIGFVPHIWGLLFPLFVFIAVIFFTSKMAIRSEIVAILACGVTYNRWLRTYVIGGLFFALVLWVAARYVLPKANAIRSSFQATFIDNHSSSNVPNNAYYLRTDSNTYIGLKSFDTATKTGYTFFLNQLSGGKLIFNLRAENMQWDTAQKNWRLMNVTERRVSAMKESITTIATRNIDLHLTPEAFRRDAYVKDNLTTPELIAFIEAEKLRANEGINTLLVERHRRTATPFSVLLLTVIGAIVAGRKTRGGSGFHLAVGIIIAVSFILFERFSSVFSVKGNLPPLIAAWIPNVLFLFVGIYLYRKAPK